MSTADKISKQIEGTMDEIKGSIQQASGDRVKGGMTKMTGKLKKATASLYDLNDDTEDEHA